MNTIRKCLKACVPGITAVSAILFAITSASAQLYLSPVTNGIYVGVGGRNALHLKSGVWLTNQVAITDNEPLALFFFSRTGSADIAIPMKSDFFLKFEMRDPSGKAVARTKAGQRWGSRFGALPKGLGQTRSLTKHMILLQVRGSHEETSATPCRGPSLPSPRDLFQMNRAGMYDLQVEVFAMQGIRGRDGKLKTWKPLAMPPFSIKVAKALDE